MYRTASSSEPLMIAQVQIVNIPNVELAKERITAASQELVELADKVCRKKLNAYYLLQSTKTQEFTKVFPSMKQFGGGARGITVRDIDTVRGKQIIVHLIGTSSFVLADHSAY